MPSGYRTSHAGAADMDPTSASIPSALVFCLPATQPKGHPLEILSFVEAVATDHAGWKPRSGGREWQNPSFFVTPRNGCGKLRLAYAESPTGLE